MSFEQNRLPHTGALACFFTQAAFGTAFTYLTSGVYLSGLAILMGAGDVLVSYISVILNICGVLVLTLSGFLERFHSRKRLTLGLTALSRLTTLFIVAIPVLVPQGMRLALFIPTVVIAFTLQAQTTVVLNQWMLGFVDARRSGRFISLPQLVLLGVWGRISDRRGHRFVLNASIWLFLGETLFLFFVSPGSWFVFIPIAFLISSVANSGFVIAVFTRRYELMPFANIRFLYLISTVGVLLLQTVYLCAERKGRG